MVALKTEDVGRRLARGRQLPAVVVGELERRARSGAGRAARHVPLGDRRDLLGKVQRHRPAAERGGAGIGDRYVHLEKIASRVGRRRRTGVRGECLPVQ